MDPETTGNLNHLVDVVTRLQLEESWGDRILEVQSALGWKPGPSPGEDSDAKPLSQQDRLLPPLGEEVKARVADTFSKMLPRREYEKFLTFLGKIL